MMLLLPPICMPLRELPEIVLPISVLPLPVRETPKFELLEIVLPLIALPLPARLTPVLLFFITLGAPVVTPPIILFLLPVPPNMPGIGPRRLGSPLPNAPMPSAVVPIRLPWIVFPVIVVLPDKIMPPIEPPLPEITLPAPVAVRRWCFHPGRLCHQLQC